MVNSNLQGSNSEGALSPFEGFDGQKILRRIIGVWPIILLCIIMFFLIGFLYLRYTPPTFLCSSSILIKEDRKGATSFADNPLLRELNAASMTKLIDNEIALLKSYDMMEEVLINLGQYSTYKSVGRFAERVSTAENFPFKIKVLNIETLDRPIGFRIELDDENNWRWQYDTTSSIGPKIVVGKIEKIGRTFFSFEKSSDTSNAMGELASSNLNDYQIDVSTLPTAVRYFMSKLTVKPASESGSVIDLQLVDFSEKRAIAILIELMRDYNQKNLLDKNEVTSNTVKFLDDRLVQFEAELKTIESKVSSFKSQNKVTSVSGEAALFLQQSGDIDLSKAQQISKLNMVEALENELITNRNNPTLVPSTLGIGEPSLSELIQKHNGMVLQKERMVKLMGPKNPLLADIDGQIYNLRESMISNIASLKRVYAQDLNSIMVRDKELSRSLVKVPEVERNLVQITRDKDVMEQLYFFLLQKREENSIALAGSVIDSRLVDSAKSEGQISPKSKPVWLAALFAGLLIPIIFVLLKDALDNTVGDKSEIEHSCMAPVLGEISYIRKLSKKIVIGEGDRSAVAEQFRTIRTQLEFTSKGRNLKRILVTSHRPGEGKSFTSLNLAASYTLLNKKVLILEFDLRKPRLAKYLDLSKSKGISSYLSGKAELDELIMEVPGFNGNFFIISAGPIPPNPAELINGDLMEKFMSELNERFDIIILDTPPFGIVADPTLLEKFADISVVVLRQGFSLKMVYNEINSRISAKNDPPMYTILNGVGMQKKYAYGYESYLYGYGYYSDDKDKKKFSIRSILDKFKI